VVLDGTLIPVDRVAADRLFYSGKHRKRGMNLQVIANPGGDIVWVSGALPGAVHDKKAEWIWGVLAELEAAATRRSRTSGRTSRHPRKRPTAPTPGSARRANAQTPSSKPGGSSGSSAAVPGAPASSPRPSTYCRNARYKEVGKASLPMTLSGPCPAGNPGWS
jgi:hypothetical protein